MKKVVIIGTIIATVLAIVTGICVYFWHDIDLVDSDDYNF